MILTVYEKYWKWWCVSLSKSDDCWESENHKTKVNFKIEFGVHKETSTRTFEIVCLK